MSKNVQINVNSENNKVKVDNKTLGITSENLQGKIIFKPEPFVDGVCRLYVDGKGSILMDKQEDCYTVNILSSLLTEDSLDVCFKITEPETEDGIPIFCSKIMHFKVLETIDSSSTIPEDYPSWEQVLDSMIAQINQMEDDAEDRLDEVVEQIQDLTSAYNTNATNKTNAFNTNATNKTTAFDEHYSAKVVEIDGAVNSAKSELDNYESAKERELDSYTNTKKTELNTLAGNLTSAFNSNASSKTSDFNDNATSKTSSFNENATSKTGDFNTNAASKVTDYNTNATTKTSEFNQNASDKTDDFDDNASAKTTAFNDNATAKIAEYDAHVSELQSQVDDLTTLVETELESNEVEGTEIDVSDSAEYRGRIEVKGNTEQNSYNGENLYDFDTIAAAVYNSLSNSRKENVVIDYTNDTITLTSWSDDAFIPQVYGNVSKINGVNITVEPNTDYILEYKYNRPEVSKVIIYGLNEETQKYETISADNIGQIKNSFNSSTYTQICIRFGTTRDSENTCVISDIKLYRASIGGNDAPNPDYPQEIKVVTGDNVIRHVGKNLLDLSNGISNHGITTTLKDDGSVDLKGTTDTDWFNMTVSSGKRTKIRLLPGKYTFSVNEALNFSLRIKAFYKNYPAEYFHITINPGKTSGTFTVPRECDNFYVYAYGLTTGTVIDLNIKLQLEEGTTPTPYESYREEEYKLDLRGTNVFDKNQFEEFTNTIKNVQLQLQPNTEYIMSSDLPGSSETVANLFFSLDTNFATDTNGVLPNQPRTLTTDSTGIAYVGYRNNRGVISGDLKNDYNYYIHETSKIIELCKIGDYSDILFKNKLGDENYNAELEEEAWYKKNLINKVVFTGNENFTLGDNSQYSDTILRFDTRIADKKLASNFTSKDNLFCDSFCVSYLNYEARTREAIAGHSNYYQLAIFINKNRLPSSDVAGLKAWLSSHNVECFYVKNTPTYEKITDTTLISQLEALRKAKWYKGVNHWWTETENLVPYIKGTYKQSNNLRLQALENIILNQSTVQSVNTLASANINEPKVTKLTTAELENTTTNVSEESEVE